MYSSLLSRSSARGAMSVVAADEREVAAARTQVEHVAGGRADAAPGRRARPRRLSSTAGGRGICWIPDSGLPSRYRARIDLEATGVDAADDRISRADPGAMSGKAGPAAVDQVSHTDTVRIGRQRPQVEVENGAQHANSAAGASGFWARCLPQAEAPPRRCRARTAAAAREAHEAQDAARAARRHRRAARLARLARGLRPALRARRADRPRDQSVRLVPARAADRGGALDRHLLVVRDLPQPAHADRGRRALEAAARRGAGPARARGGRLLLQGARSSAASSCSRARA